MLVGKDTLDAGQGRKEGVGGGGRLVKDWVGMLEKELGQEEGVLADETSYFPSVDGIEMSVHPSQHPSSAPPYLV